MIILYNKFFKMAKVWGLDVPLEFSDGFNKFLKLNWQNKIQRVTIADSKPALARSSHIAGRSYIPDFVDDWQSLTEEQQSKWLKDWGDGSQQAFALFFQNNYYRQINDLQIRTTPNFFTYPAGWLHIAASDTNVILRFDIISGDYILSDPANILHLQNFQQCNFGASYYITATINAKLKNIATPESAQCKPTITQYYTDNEGNKSRQIVKDAISMNGANLECVIEHTFSQDDPSEIITGFRIDFEFSNAVGDIWFYAGEISAVDDVLGVVRLHNVINFQDVEKIFNGHLANIKNQWSLIGANAGTTLRRVFPYAYGYPEETEAVNLIKNGNFDTDLSEWWASWPWIWDNGCAYCPGSGSDMGQEIEGIVIGKNYKLEFDVIDGNGGRMNLYVGNEDEGKFFIEYDGLMSNGHHEFEGKATTELAFVDFWQLGWNGKIDNVKLTEI